MTTCPCTSALALTFLAPSAALMPTGASHSSLALSPTEAVALHARFDPSLGALRAGRINVPVPFAASERAELLAAQERSTALAALRAGSEPTNHEWRWLAIGAGIVLLIVLI